MVWNVTGIRGIAEREKNAISRRWVRWQIDRMCGETAIESVRRARYRVGEHSVVSGMALATGELRKDVALSEPAASALPLTHLNTEMPHTTSSLPQFCPLKPRAFLLTDTAADETRRGIRDSQRVF